MGHAVDQGPVVEVGVENIGARLDLGVGLGVFAVQGEQEFVADQAPVPQEGGNILQLEVLRHRHLDGGVGLADGQHVHRRLPAEHRQQQAHPRHEQEVQHPADAAGAAGSVPADRAPGLLGAVQLKIVVIFAQGLPILRVFPVDPVLFVLPAAPVGELIEQVVLLLGQLGLPGLFRLVRGRGLLRQRLPVLRQEFLPEIVVRGRGLSRQRLCFRWEILVRQRLRLRGSFRLLPRSRLRGALRLRGGGNLHQVPPEIVRFLLQAGFFFVVHRSSVPEGIVPLLRTTFPQAA